MHTDEVLSYLTLHDGLALHPLQSRPVLSTGWFKRKWAEMRRSWKQRKPKV